MTKPTLEEIKTVLLEKGMKVFTAPYDITLGGIRTSDNAANTFNDWLFMLYHDNEGKLCGLIEYGTTDAGLYYRLNPIHPKGTAIIAHSFQNIKCYRYMTTGGHRGQEAFRQVGEMKYWRDADRDKYLEFDGVLESANHATNIHDMGTRGALVHNWSAGCCGSVESVMDAMYTLARLQVKHGHGHLFSFAMLHENDFKQ